MKTKRTLAPFSWAGGKRLVADIVWQALGAPRVYVGPFFGSGAVLLSRGTAHIEFEKKSPHQNRENFGAVTSLAR